MALSSGIIFLSIIDKEFVLYFERRDIILLAGTIFFVIGLIPFMAPVYAIVIGGALFIGTKSFIFHRKKSIEKDTGEGFCVECGDKISGNKCPTCD